MNLDYLEPKCVYGAGDLSKNLGIEIPSRESVVYPLLYEAFSKWNSGFKINPLIKDFKKTTNIQDDIIYIVYSGKLAIICAEILYLEKNITSIKRILFCWDKPSSKNLFNDFNESIKHQGLEKLVDSVRKKT